MTPEAWLEKHGITCHRHSARISKAACARYMEENPDQCKGCSGHKATPLSTVRRQRPVGGVNLPKKNRPACAVDGCDLPSRTKKLCSKHYMQQLRGKTVPKQEEVPVMKLDHPNIEREEVGPMKDKEILCFSGDDALIVKRWCREVLASGGDPVGDAAVVLECFLDGAIQFTGGAE